MNPDIEVNGVQKKVVQALRQPYLLGIIPYGGKNAKSNKELSNELDEPVSNISYATKKLEEKDVVKDTEVLEEDKTSFTLKEGVNVQKTYEFGSMIDHTAYVHAISAALIIAYSFIFYEPVLQRQGIFLTMFIAGLIGLAPSFLFNIYKMWNSMESYKLLISREK